MRNRQLRSLNRLGAVPHDVEVECARPPVLVRLPVSSPLQLDGLAVRQQLGGLQPRFEKHHLVEIWRLPNPPPPPPRGAVSSTRDTATIRVLGRAPRRERA